MNDNIDKTFDERKRGLRRTRVDSPWQIFPSFCGIARYLGLLR